METKPTPTEPAPKAGSEGSPEMMVVPVAKTYGWLTVRTATYANTVLDGKPFKPTPFNRQKVQSGEHTLELRAPDTGKIVYQEKFVLLEGHTKVIKVR